MEIIYLVQLTCSSPLLYSEKNNFLEFDSACDSDSCQQPVAMVASTK